MRRLVIPALALATCLYGLGARANPAPNLPSPTYRYIQSVAGKAIADRYATLVEAASKKWHLDPLLVASVIRLESGFNSHEISNVGARGLMQVMPFHFAERHIPKKKWTDPAVNLDLGCHLLAWYKKRMEFTYPGLSDDAIRQRTLVAYNMGPRAVSRGIYRSRYSDIIMKHYHAQMDDGPITSVTPVLPGGGMYGPEAPKNPGLREGAEPNPFDLPNSDSEASRVAPMPEASNEPDQASASSVSALPPR